uniref:Uncharacterized protein n=1 Tax=Cyprinus carpio carpio TaxID=630221 RepID=A0A8C1DZI0_CYPCA
MTTTLVFVFRFKERLKTKYLRELRQKQQLSGSLDSRKWCFLSPGLDDFRDGYPAVHKELFTRVRVDPPLQSLGLKIKCVTKQNPQSQAQREFIDAVEHKLKPYPLALCPHLESGMITELFDQVLSVLDPDLRMKGELSIISPTKNMEHQEESRAHCEISTPQTIKPSITIKGFSLLLLKARPRNPYKWQETLDIKPKRLFNLLSQGGETSDLTKPSLTVPINKTDPNQTPAKTCSSVEEHHKGQSVKDLTPVYKPKRPLAVNDPLRAMADITGSLDFKEQLSKTVTFIASTSY